MSFESALTQHLVRVYDLQAERVHVDSTSARAYVSVNDEGLFQFGPSKDHRPDLPQVKVMQAVLDPLGMPLATDVVSGERADDPLYVPCIERVQARLGRSGLLYVGDCKMASRQTRAWMAAQGSYYLCALPQIQLSEGELEAAVESAVRGDVELRAVYRKTDNGQAELSAQGYERQVPMALDVAGQRQNWLERRFVVQSLRHAKASEAALRARVAKAQTQVEALNRRGRGRKRFEEIDELRQAVNVIVQRPPSRGLLVAALRATGHVTPRASVPGTRRRGQGRSPSYRGSARGRRGACCRRKSVWLAPVRHQSTA